MSENVERFFSKVKYSHNCWHWVGAKYWNGYGLFHPKIRAHRWSYEYFIGPIPKDLLVLHHCDTRNCVNPFHLYLGTYADNNRDTKERGRSRAGMPRKYDYKELVKLRKLGFSIREITLKTGAFSGSIQNALLWNRMGLL